MAWVRRYYSKIFPEGNSRARAHLRRTEEIVMEQPNIGHASDRVEGARELHIQRTPFTFLYRPFPDRIEVLRVIDERSDWAKSES
jgi:plasmid stabilization system protein ParE